MKYGIFAKIVLIAGSGLALGYSARAVIPAALALANMGEFSFVLLTQALDEEILSQTLHNVILASVMVTMVVSLVIFLAQESVVSWVESLQGVARVHEEAPV